MFNLIGEVIGAIAQSISEPVAIWISRRFGLDKTPVVRFFIQLVVFGLTVVPIFILAVWAILTLIELAF